MASGDCDRIEVMESSLQAKGAAEDRSAINESDSEDDDHDKSSNAERNASYDVSMGGAGVPGGAGGKVHKSDRKIGHRRVGVGGEITYKKIQTSQIMGSIQLGIQHAVGGLASKPERDLLMQDFMTVETTNFPNQGSNHTPAHHYSEFKFKTYAPIAFRYFRDLFGIQPDDFLMSMCSSPMRELSNPGASGSIFYLTEDDEFIVKTVQHKEGEFLQKLLPGYYMNLNQNPRTLLPKFFGLYCYQCNSKNVRLVVMNNLLPSVVRLHQKYDLKGSTYKRKASKSEQKKRSPTYKDLDFMEHHPEGIFLEADTYTALVKTIQRDCRVLESFKIMDYSLLVGVHNLDEAAREKAASRLEEAAQQEGTTEGGDTSEGHQLNRTRPDVKTKEDFSAHVRRTQSINRQRLVAHSTAMESIQAESEPIDEEEDVPPGGIPARNARGERLLLFIGVIDILQSYRLRKKLEHTWKSMIHDGDTVSVHKPGFYAQRFQDFMAKTVFKKIPSLDLPEIKGNHRKFRTLVTSYIALKHSPSKRKSITRPLRPHDEIETPGWRARTLRNDEEEEEERRPYFRTVPSRVSMRLKTGSVLSLTEEGIDFPVVLSDMNKMRTEMRQPSPEFPYGYPGAFPRRAEYARDARPGSRQSSSSYERRRTSETRMRGRLREQNSLADSGIQTDSGSNTVHTESTIDDVVRSIPYIDDSSGADDTETAHRPPADDSKASTFFERCKKAVVDLFFPHSSDNLTRATSYVDIGSAKLESREHLYKSQTLPTKAKMNAAARPHAKSPSPILEERRYDVNGAQTKLNDALLKTLDVEVHRPNVESIPS